MSHSQECFTWRDTGACNFGDNCRFLHGDADTRGSLRKQTQPCWTFRDTGSCTYGDDCRFSHDPAAVEAAAAAAAAAPAKAPAARRENRPPRRRNKKAPRANGDANGTAVPQDAETRLQCNQFQTDGTCTYGDRCRFLHGEQATRGSRRKTEEVCFDLRDGNTCKWGDNCRYSHDLSLATAEPKAAAEKRVCWRFRDNGECQYGEECRFSHAAVEVAAE